jgi:hypothetical protein
MNTKKNGPQSNSKTSDPLTVASDSKKTKIKDPSSFSKESTSKIKTKKNKFSKTFNKTPILLKKALSGKTKAS